MALRKQHKKEQDEILTINMAKKIMSNKKNGIQVEGFHDEIDKASSFLKAKFLYETALNNKEMPTLTPLQELKADMLEKEKEMKQVGGKLLLNLKKEAKTLDKVMIIFDDNANASKNPKQADILKKAATVAEKMALQANILAKTWKKQYNVKDAILHEEPNFDDFGPFFISEF